MHLARVILNISTHNAMCTCGTRDVNTSKAISCSAARCMVCEGQYTNRMRVFVFTCDASRICHNPVSHGSYVSRPPFPTCIAHSAAGQISEVPRQYRKHRRNQTYWKCPQSIGPYLFASRTLVCPHHLGHSAVNDICYIHLAFAHPRY